MILQIVADAGRIEHDVDAVLLQQFRGSDARELQQLRRIIRAARDQNFLARLQGDAEISFLLVFDRPRAAPFEQDALQRRSLDARLALDGGTKMGAENAEVERARRPAPRRGLEEARAFLGGTVEIGIGGNADFGRSDDKGFRQRIGMAPVRHRQRSACAMIFVGAALLVLGLLEIGQHVIAQPALPRWRQRS